MRCRRSAASRATTSCTPQLNEDNRRAQHRAFWLIAVFVPAVTMIGNLVTVAVLGYGALRVMDGDLAVGVLVSFLLYLRRFFDPLQDIAMFYNSYQSASAGAGEAVRRARGALRRRRAGRPARRCRTRPPARCVFDGVRFGYGGATVLPQLDLDHPGRPDGRAGRRDRRRQVHAGPAGRAVLRPGRPARCGSTACRWTGSPTPTCAGRW